MYQYDVEELKLKIVAEWTVDELLDALCFDISDLVELLSDEIEENKEELESRL